jgi:hypothetical protein
MRRARELEREEARLKRITPRRVRRRRPKAQPLEVRGAVAAYRRAAGVDPDAPCPPREPVDEIKVARRLLIDHMGALEYAKLIRRKLARSSVEGKYSQKTLEQLTEEGKTYVINGVPRFPIADKEDPKNAIAMLGEVDLQLRPSVKKYITRRAVEMRLTFLLPDHWTE